MEFELLEHASKYPPQQTLKVDDNVEEIVLGRHPNNALCLKSVSISRRHAVIRKTESGYDLHEQKAVNRVYVNDVLLPHGATRTLVNNDQVQLGVKPNPSEPATHNSEYFIYRLSFESCRKRKHSSSSPTSSKQVKVESDSSTLINILQQKAEQEAEAAAAAKEEAKTRAAAEAKAETEKAELEKELALLRELQDAQKAKEEALRQEMMELKQKQTEKAEELAKKLEDREKEFEEVKDEQSRKSMEMSKKLQERDQELEEAKVREMKMGMLEEQLKSTREEQERLSSAATKMAVQEKITDLLEEQLQCAICSELMIKPKNFPCSHAYCGYCIDKWLTKKKECPVCRCKVSTATPNYLLSNLIEKAVEELSEELKLNRATVILAREDEMSKKSQPANKGKKKNSVRQANAGRQANTGRQVNAPASTVTRATTSNAVNNPSTSQSASSSHPAARASTPSTASDGRNSSEELIDLTSDSEFENGVTHEVYEGILSSDEDYMGEPEYDVDIEYTGVSGGTHAGYGSCYHCGDPGHWRPDCPYR